LKSFARRVTQRINRRPRLGPLLATDLSIEANNVTTLLSGYAHKHISSLGNPRRLVVTNPAHQTRPDRNADDQSRPVSGVHFDRTGVFQ
jgi:hypothetical protein